MDKIKGKTLIGITGGIGSGKSEVCSYLSKRGFYVLSADLLAKELYNKDKKLASALVKRYGNDILNFKKKINLARLRDVIFASKKNYLDANKIVHPVVIKHLASLIKKARNKLIIIESAILFESSFDKYLSYVVMVYSNKLNRIKRIMLRDGASRKDVEKIMKYQMEEKKKIEKANFVLVNNKSLDGLSEEIELLIKVLNAIK